MPVTVHTESSPEEEIANLPGLSGTAVLVPDHADPIIWAGKARNGLKISARVYKGNKARGLKAAVAKLPPAGSSPLTAGTVPKGSKKLNIVDDEDDDDDDYDDDDHEYRALLQRSSNALNRRVGIPAVVIKPVEKLSSGTTAPAVVSAVVKTSVETPKAAGFLDSCSPAKETGELVAMKTGKLS